MLIINADDWGRSERETDAALSCYQEGRITSVSAMVFMQDSERAADLARANGVDVGLHLNLSQLYDGDVPSPRISDEQKKIVRFMRGSKYAVLIYHPGLRTQFRSVYQAQLNEFFRLYGKAPSHVDGHQHRHLCANILLGDVIPRGQKIRRNFSYWPGEKRWVNRLYRCVTDRLLARRYKMTDFFFSLAECLRASRVSRVAELAKKSDVELMAHPVNQDEHAWLTGRHSRQLTNGVQLLSFAALT